MAAPLLLTIFYVVLTTTCALVTKPPRNETLSVLLLASTATGYNTSPSTLSKWVNDLLINKGAAENWGYQLQLSLLDTKCDEEAALNGFLDQVCPDGSELSSGGNNSTLIAVLGGGCVTDSELILSAIGNRQRKIPFISYSPFLHTSENPTPSGGVFHFQMYPSLRGVVTTLVATLRYYGWTQMSIISEFNYPFLQMELDLVTALTAANITVLQPSHIQQEVQPVDVPYLFAKYARVIFLNMYENKAAQILCHAFQEGKYYPDYVWILYGWYSNNWWTRTPTSCNSSALLTALERAIILQPYPTTQHTADNVMEWYQYSYIPPLLNDSVWLLSQALNMSNALLCNETSDCDYEGSGEGPHNNSFILGDILSSKLLEANFEGKSGHVEFDENGIRTYSQVKLFQFRNPSNDRAFAYVELDTEQFYYKDDEGNQSVWPDGIPLDGSPVDVVKANSVAVAALIYALSFAAICFTFVCLGFNIIFRKRKIVKLTSPNLNYFIIAGALLMYTAGITQVTPSSSLEVMEHMCRAQAPTLSIGYVLCYGTIIAKLWRIFYIFHNPTTKKKEIKDWHLTIAILIIVAIIVVIVASGFFFPGVRPHAHLRSDRGSPPMENEKGIIENYFSIGCYTARSLFWRLVFHLYLAILQAIALVLAFKIRKIEIKVLNDSKQISAIVYVTTVINAELILVSILLYSYKNIALLLYYGGVIIVATLIVGLIYIPKMRALYRDPQGKKIFGNVVIHSSESSKNAAFHAERSQILALEKEVQSLQTQLQQQSIDKVIDEKQDGAV